MRRTSLTTAAAAVALLLAVVLPARPAAATVHPFDLGLVSGRLSLGGVDVDRTWSPPLPCPGDSRLSGTVATGSATGNMAATLAIEWPLTAAVLVPFGDHVLLATDAATGDYDDATDHLDVDFDSIDLSIRELDTGNCSLGDEVCAGSAALTVSGDLYADLSPFGVLPHSAGDLVAVNAIGEIGELDFCDFPFSLFLDDDTALNIGDNPNDDVWPPTTDPGAFLAA